MRARVGLGSLVAVLLTLPLVPLRVVAEQPEVPPPEVVMPLELVPIRRRPLALNQDHVLIPEPEGTGLKRVHPAAMIASRKCIPLWWRRLV